MPRPPPVPCAPPPPAPRAAAAHPLPTLRTPASEPSRARHRARSPAPCRTLHTAHCHVSTGGSLINIDDSTPSMSHHQLQRSRHGGHPPSCTLQLEANQLDLRTHQPSPRPRPVPLPRGVPARAAELELEPGQAAPLSARHPSLPRRASAPLPSSRWPRRARASPVRPPQPPNKTPALTPLAALSRAPADRSEGKQWRSPWPAPGRWAAPPL
jgi:hypothetical protein